MIDRNEAENWTIERLRFELETLERKYDNLGRELREIEEDYYDETPETNPSAFDRHGMRLADAAPVGLTSIPPRMDRIEKEIRMFRSIIRKKM